MWQSRKAYSAAHWLQGPDKGPWATPENTGNIPAERETSLVCLLAGCEGRGGHCYVSPQGVSDLRASSPSHTNHSSTKIWRETWAKEIRNLVTNVEDNKHVSCPSSSLHPCYSQATSTFKFQHKLYASKRVGRGGLKGTGKRNRKEESQEWHDITKMSPREKLPQMGSVFLRELQSWCLGESGLKVKFEFQKKIKRQLEESREKKN